jgi:hypothetical protein
VLSDKPSCLEKIMGYRAKPERERCRALAQEERLPRMRRGGTATSLMTVEGSNGPEQEISAKRSQFLKRAASFPQCLRLVDAPTGRFFCQTKPVFHDAATGVFEGRGLPTRCRGVRGSVGALLYPAMAFGMIRLCPPMFGYVRLTEKSESLF